MAISPRYLFLPTKANRPINLPKTSIPENSKLQVDPTLLPCEVRVRRGQIGTTLVLGNVPSVSREWILVSSFDFPRYSLPR